MNTLRNHVQLIGNVGKDVELKTVSNGNFVANFSLATNEYYKNNKGEKVKETQWHNIVIWGKQAELASKLLHKGTEVCLQGKLMHRSYEGQDGNTKYVSEIKVSEFMKLTKAETEAEAVPF